MKGKKPSPSDQVKTPAGGSGASRAPRRSGSSRNPKGPHYAGGESQVKKPLGTKKSY